MSYLDTTLDARSNSYHPNIAQYTEKQISVLPVKFTVDNNEYVFPFSVAIQIVFLILQKKQPL